MSDGQRVLELGGAVGGPVDISLVMVAWG